MPILGLQGGFSAFLEGFLSCPLTQEYARIEKGAEARLIRSRKEATNMIRWTRSARMVPGKLLQTVQWGKEIVEFANKKYKIQVSFYMDFFGESGTIRWFCDYADLAAFEKVANQLLADQEYLQKVTKGAEFLISGSVFDTVMRAI